ncbi:hypothetical protein NN561_008435 [Cricetulus griseus]
MQPSKEAWRHGLFWSLPNYAYLYCVYGLVRTGRWELVSPAVVTVPTRPSPRGLDLTRRWWVARASRSCCSCRVPENTTASTEGGASLTQESSKPPGRQTPAEGRAQARRAAQARCWQEDGGRIQNCGTTGVLQEVSERKLPT